MARQTKAQRIAVKIGGGMSHIEAEIEVAQEDAAAKIADLRARQDREESKVRATIVELLESEHPEVFESLRTKARRRLENEVARRRQRSKGSAAAAVPTAALAPQGETREG